MKLHRILVEAVVGALQKIFNDGKHADDVVEKTIASDKRWGARDRHFIADAIYDVVRNYRLYQHCAQSENPWHLLEAKFIVAEIEAPKWENFGSLNVAEVLDRHEKAQAKSTLKFSIPDWLAEVGVRELGEAQWESEMAAMHTGAKVCLRLNTLKTTIENALKQLADEGIEAKLLDDAVILAERKNIQNSIAFKSGWVEVQDANSQKVGKLLNPQPGELVIDACAGAGGKTLHLAALMQNKGEIFAFDIFDKKLDELQKRATRAGVKIVQCALMDFTVQNHFFEKADKLLLDVPCSGLGVLRRNPDTKWKLTPELLNHYRMLQWEIISSYHSMLKHGGQMLYTTCSILPSENQRQVQRFLNEHKGSFILVEEHFLSPAGTGFDGFYIALLKKK